MDSSVLPDPFVRMRKILDEHPDLSASGFRVATCSDSEFMKCRRNLFDDLDQVRKVIRILKVAPRTKSSQVNSYGLKHTLERWLTLYNGQHEYVSNGAAILACLLLDIAVKPVQPSSERRTDPNAEVGIDWLWHLGAKTVIDEWHSRKA
jgi:hypothetical protein